MDEEKPHVNWNYDRPPEKATRLQILNNSATESKSDIILGIRNDK